ncbi:hypothetical protein [Nocardioides zeae]
MRDPTGAGRDDEPAPRHQPMSRSRTEPSASGAGWRRTPPSTVPSAARASSTTVRGSSSTASRSSRAKSPCSATNTSRRRRRYAACSAPDAASATDQPGAGVRAGRRRAVPR